MHTAQLMPLPLTVSCFRKIQIGFSFLVLAHLVSPGKRAVKRVCVCVCSTDNERPHHCCHLPNKVEDVDRMPDILHTLLQTGKCPSPGGSGAACNTWFLGLTESPYHKQQLNWFSHFCRVQGCDQQTHKPCYICSNRPHLAFVLPCSRKTTSV